MRDKFRAIGKQPLKSTIGRVGRSDDKNFKGREKGSNQSRKRSRSRSISPIRSRISNNSNTRNNTLIRDARERFDLERGSRVERNREGRNKLRMDEGRRMENERRFGQGARAERRNNFDKPNYRHGEDRERDRDQRWGHSGYNDLYKKEFDLKRKEKSFDQRRMSPPSTRRSRSPIRNKSSRTRHEEHQSSSQHVGKTEMINVKRFNSIKNKERLEGGESNVKPSTITLKKAKPKTMSIKTVRSILEKSKLKNLEKNAGLPLSPSSASSGSPKHKSKIVNSANKSDSKESRGSKSDGMSSSEDEDVLQLHPKTKGRSRSFSYSGSSSSEESNSDSSASSHLKTKKNIARNSSTSTYSDSESYYSDFSAKENPIRKADLQNTSKTQTNKKSDITQSTSSPIASSSSRVPKVGKDLGAKSSRELGKNSTRIISQEGVGHISSPNPKQKMSSITNKRKGSGKLQTQKKRPEKIRSDSGETDTSTESSSESDSEPRMTLSERFAKLNQMCNDKREFAKPILSPDEIDKKLKVVKDLKSSDMKVFIASPSPKVQSKRSRPDSPECGVNEKLYSSVERRRHFEKMQRDEPQDRPSDWSDVRVRYNYYKDRGYFNERPLDLEAYVKWENWWYAYRDWLANTGYYDRKNQDHSEPRYDERDVPMRSSWGHQSHYPPSHNLRTDLPTRRVERYNTLPSRQIFQREPQPLPLNHVPIRSRIGRIPGGSLVVNIRQGNSLGTPSGFGRRVGVVKNVNNSRM